MQDLTVTRPSLVMVSVGYSTHTYKQLNLAFLA